ncbi:hypothetical protein DL96DRAFT_6439 [Flagelloscypha sp. PMI_526]|nr:hypothetical protein DL96DRAFT_6439 [Flagelloscypha sp. PMI_526]
MKVREIARQTDNSVLAISSTTLLVLALVEFLPSYSSTSSTLSAKPKPSIPNSTSTSLRCHRGAHRDKENSRRILEVSLKSLLPLNTLNKSLVKKAKSRQCRAFICAVNPNNNASPRLFRTYRSRESTAPPCTVLDALLLCLADGYHMEPYPLGDPVELFSGSGHRFSNPTSRCMQEIQAVEGDSRALSCIVSIGVGVTGLLLEEDPRAILRDCEREAEELRRRCSERKASSFG